MNQHIELEKALAAFPFSFKTLFLTNSVSSSITPHHRFDGQNGSGKIQSYQRTIPIVIITCE